MIATVHLADLGSRGAAAALLRRPGIDGVSGLRWAETMVAVPLASSRPPLSRRVGLMAFWDGEDAVDHFVEDHPAGRRFTGGFHARLRPLRAFGSWPGLPPEVPSSRAVPHDGPVAVFTLGMLRLSQALRFVRASRPAERSAVGDDAMLWGTAALTLARPFVATFTIWRSSQAAATYAYGRQRPQHRDAIAAQQRKDFHRRSAFIRFAPLRIDGELSGTNPVSAETLS